MDLETVRKLDEGRFETGTTVALTRKTFMIITAIMVETRRTDKVSGLSLAKDNM